MYVYGQLLRAAVETLSSDPSTSADKFTGRIWYNTSTDLLKYTDASGNIHQFLGHDVTQTVTNKTISGSSNTLSNIAYASLVLTGTIVNADISGSAAIAYSKLNLSGAILNADINASAAIAYSKLAALTASRALVSDGSGFVSAHGSTTSTEVGYLAGVTSAIQTQIDAKQARSTLTTKGDIYVATASATVARQAIGTNGQVLTADSAQTNGLKWADPSDAPTQSYELSNLALATSVGSSALTIALKDKDGNDPSAGSPVKVGFRNATSTTGTYTQVSITGSLSITVNSTATLGHTSGIDQWIYVYLINNSGTAELAVSSYLFDEGSILSTTVINTSSDSAITIYSGTARSNVPVRLIGRLKSNQVTAGTWDANMSEISLVPFQSEPNIVESVVADTAWPAIAGQYGDATSISLTPGRWAISLHGYGRNGGVTTTTSFLIGVSTTSGNSGTGLDDTTNQSQASPVNSNASAAIEFLTVPSYIVKVNSTTTYYYKVLANTSVANLAFGGRITAVRLNQ